MIQTTVQNQTPKIQPEQAGSDTVCTVKLLIRQGMRRSRQVVPAIILARFWAKINRTSKDECWPWLGARTAAGYGIAKLARRNYSAQRLAYWFFTGDNPAGFVVMHSCDNPPCCNPAHLVKGTQQQNVHDAMRKGRHVFPDHRQRRHVRNQYSK